MLSTMADLQSIYKEFGLQGIVPYAFQRGGEAYQFLIEKMKEEVPWYLIISEVTTVPYLDMTHLGAYAAVCLSEEQAKAVCDRLAHAGMLSHPVKLVAAEEKENAMLQIRDLGAIGVQIDDSLLIYIQDVVAAVEYDGFKSINDPLRNSAMNAVLYMLCQKIATGIPHKHLLQYLFCQIQAGHLLVPVAVADSAHGTLGKDDFIVPIMHTEDGCSVVLVFTDTASFQSACAYDEKIKRLFPQKLTYVAEYRFLVEMLTEKDGVAIVLNPGTANLNIDRASMISLETAVMTSADGKETNDLADEEDPVPDFLK